MMDETPLLPWEHDFEFSQASQSEKEEEKVSALIFKLKYFNHRGDAGVDFWIWLQFIFKSKN
jgi:hypothetical protein